MRPSRTNWTIGSRCLALAALVRARVIDIRRLFHGLALGAAVFARRGHTRTNGMCELLTFCGSHFFSPGFGSTAASDPSAILRSWDHSVCPVADTFLCTQSWGCVSFGTASVAPHV